jgi:hypothetical protein|tara:strand:- start:6309 stop:6473 length:165 start_codon:yes stop_codon:yes gene_type:complete
MLYLELRRNPNIALIMILIKKIQIIIKGIINKILIFQLILLTNIQETKIKLFSI